MRSRTLTTTAPYSACEYLKVRRKALPPSVARYTNWLPLCPVIWSCCSANVAVAGRSRWLPMALHERAPGLQRQVKPIQNNWCEGFAGQRPLRSLPSAPSLRRQQTLEVTYPDSTARAGGALARRVTEEGLTAFVVACDLLQRKLQHRVEQLPSSFNFRYGIGIGRLQGHEPIVAVPRVATCQHDICEHASIACN